MTNKEAIRRILDHKRVHSLNEPRAVLINEALDLAIKALEEPEVYMNGKDYNLYLEGYKQGKKDFERPQGDWRDNLIEVFRQYSMVGGDMFHLSEIEQIINGEAI